VKIIIIAAVAENGVIGNNGKLPWHIPEDLKRFKELTSENIVLMGRRTFESLGSKPLPNRANFVISKSLLGHGIDNVVVCPDLPMPIAVGRYSKKDLYIIGGAEIYKQTINLADKLLITRVHQSPEGDSYFPEIPTHRYGLLSARFASKDYRFETYVKK